MISRRLLVTVAAVAPLTRLTIIIVPPQFDSHDAPRVTHVLEEEREHDRGR